jgi:Domain of unknown function (DUF4126)
VDALPVLALSTQTLPWLAMAVVAAFLCGLRPFAVVLCLGLASALGVIQLPAGLQLDSPLALSACAVLALAERLADAKALSGHSEDLLLAALRVPCGAVLLAAVCLDWFGAWGWLGLPCGAALALSGQALKAAVRSMGTLLGWRHMLVLVALAIDLSVPATLALAWRWPALGMLWLTLLLLVALPLAVWWVRELRSRWRRWALLASEVGSAGGR